MVANITVEDYSSSRIPNIYAYDFGAILHPVSKKSRSEVKDNLTKSYSESKTVELNLVWFRVGLSDVDPI